MKLRVLTIDGGGIRGIIPAAILAYLESRIQEISNKPTARIIDYIDFISGTATGSITAASMIIPNNNDKAKYSMNNIVDFYVSLSASVFDIPKKYKWKTLGGAIGPLIPIENIEKIFLHIFDHIKMNQLIKPAIFPAYDIDKKKVVLYTTNDTNHKYGDFFVKDVIRGTTATPYIFKPGYFRNGVDIHTIIDGGLIATNPSLITMFELFKRSIFPPEIIFISIGTGISKHNSYNFNEARFWGRLKWFLPLIDIVKSANIELVSYQLQKAFEIRKHPENYIRINPSIEYASPDMFDASEKNIQNLLKDAKEYIDNNKETLNILAQRLYDERTQSEKLIDSIDSIN